MRSFSLFVLLLASFLVKPIKAAFLAFREMSVTNGSGYCKLSNGTKLWTENSFKYDGSKYSNWINHDYGRVTAPSAEVQECRDALNALGQLFAIIGGIVVFIVIISVVICCCCRRHRSQPQDDGTIMYNQNPGATYPRQNPGLNYGNPGAPAYN